MVLLKVLIPQLYSSSTFFFFSSSCIVIDIQHYMSLRYTTHSEMMTTSDLLNMDHLIQINMKEIENNCFPCDENSIYFLNNFYTMYSSVIFIMCVTSLTLIYLVTGSLSFLFFKNYFWLHWVFIALQRLSLVAANGGYSTVSVHGILTAVASLVVEHRLLACRLQQLQGIDSVAEAHGLQRTGSVVVVPSCTMACEIFLDQGLNLCLLHWQEDSIHCATREVLEVVLF